MTVLTFLQSATDIIFLHTLFTVNGPSHLFYRSLNILTKSPGIIKYFVAGWNLDCSNRLIPGYSTMDSILVLAE